MNREELIHSPEYWMVKIQNDLFNVIESYRAQKGLSRTQLAEEFGVSKGYISQVLNGDFDHRISKLVELALKVIRAPVVTFDDLAMHLPIAGSDYATTISTALELEIDTSETISIQADAADSIPAYGNLRLIAA